MLQLLFTAFPGGLPGISLLLLRTVLGAAMVVQGVSELGGVNRTPATWCLGLSALASGGLIPIGLLTPVAGLAAGLNVIGAALRAGPGTAHVFNSEPALIFGLTMIGVIVGAGPGRLSLDARLFGRREIIIPLPQR